MDVFRLVLLSMCIVLASLLPANAVEPLERAQVSSPHLEDSLGSPISKNVNINQQVQITADITNNQEFPQDFVYIVQVKNNEEVIIQLVWFKGKFEPGQKFSPAISWVPDSSGTFVAEIFVWVSLTNPDALSKPVFINITAS